ncbi:Putative AH/BAR domain superfamily, PX domain superfamily protein [Septoria linicola]|uniref:Sorting nexin-4 n=1 Tax=Septoria linicola TaxID=215465 RepID=A0A9Q9B150_9PEZI|nr:Putative AH/BAR domain superfamily, PX domain superfamily protein [Septoria linicola]
MAFGDSHSHDSSTAHHSVWNNCNQTCTTTTAQQHHTSSPPPPPPPPPIIDSYEASPVSSAHSSVIDLNSHAGSALDDDDDDDDDDFELIDDTHLPESHYDGHDSPNEEGIVGGLSSNLRKRYKKYQQRPQRRFSNDAPSQPPRPSGTSNMDGPSRSSNDYDSPEWNQAGDNADSVDLAGPGARGKLVCVVGNPQKEGEGTQTVYVSYQVTTDTDFQSYQRSHTIVRRRFTDFVFLYRTLAKEYPQCAVPPLPDKHNMSYVRGDRFGPDFTARRAYSLNRFLKRLTMHPVLRRATLLTLFLESSDWNATMKSRPNRGMSGSDGGGGGVLESWTDSFLNAFTKPHKTDRKFQEVNERASKLDDDLNTVSVNDELTKFATSVNSTSEGWQGLKEFTDQDYLGSLKDMEAYILSVKALLKTREQKQLDFEALTDYLAKAAQERDTLASHGSMGASGFLRQKIEDVRGVDHEQSRRERQRKLEVQISRLTTEVEAAKKTSEAFDEEVVKEVSDFERIKAVEFRDELGGLADANINFFQGNIQIWERFIEDMDKQQAEADAARA